MSKNKEGTEYKKPYRIRLWHKFSDSLDEAVGFYLFLIVIVSILSAWAIFELTDSEKKLELAIGVLATGFSLSFNYRAHRIAKDKLFKELFIEFNKKYVDKYNDTLIRIEESYTDLEGLPEAQQYILEPAEKAIIIDYLSLCAEEYLWYLRGRIPHKVWDSWEAGMVYYFSLIPIKKVLQEEKGQFASYYTLFHYLGKKHKNLFEEQDA